MAVDTPQETSTEAAAAGISVEIGSRAAKLMGGHHARHSASDAHMNALDTVSA
jgi:hypothetical protein